MFFKSKIQSITVKWKKKLGICEKYDDLFRYSNFITNIKQKDGVSEIIFMPFLLVFDGILYASDIV